MINLMFAVRAFHILGCFLCGNLGREDAIAARVGLAQVCHWLIAESGLTFYRTNMRSSSEEHFHKLPYRLIAKIMGVERTRPGVLSKAESVKRLLDCYKTLDFLTFKYVPTVLDT